MAKKESKNTTILDEHMMGGSYVNLQVWFGDPKKPAEGETIPVNSIDSFKIRENMFTLLPTMSLKICDRGRFFMSRAICIGDMINIRVGPSEATSGADMEVKPFLQASFIVQTVTCSPTASSSFFVYEILCIYAAQPLINEIGTFPKELPFGGALLYFKSSSSDVIKTMAQEAGLGPSIECSPSDYSYWINASETRGAFIERILDHAWVGEGNAPVAYTDVHGILHYTSVKDICKNVTTTKFADINGAITNGVDGKDPRILFDQARSLNPGGPILNRGGYGVKYSMYNPWNKDGIWMLDLPQHNGLGGALGQVVSFAGSWLGLQDRTEGYREQTYKKKKPDLATIYNKQASEMSNITIHKDGGMWSKELHEFYNIAPKHNEMVRRSFFNNFVNVVVDTSRQSNLYNKEAYRPKLGQVVDVDFTMAKKVDAIHSGKYCVAEIVHRYERSKPYVQQITFVNDGYYGK